MIFKFVVAVSLMMLMPAQKPQSSHRPGHFQGQLILTPMPDGIHMEVLSSFGYTDWQGDTLTAGPGFTTDGASIPRVAWSIIGGPWDGKYRNAAVVHDVGCDYHQLTWQATHELFYDAMIDSGVPEPQALTMFWAVWNFGPRWTHLETVSLKTSAQIADKADKLSKSLPPNQKVTVDFNQPVSKNLLVLDIQDRYNAELFAVTPIKNVDASELRAFLKRAEQREHTSNPMTLEEIELGNSKETLK